MLKTITTTGHTQTSIVYVKNYRDQICNDLVYLQYYFSNEAHPIQPQKHGNAKYNIHNYCKVKLSVKEKARKQRNTSRSVASNVEEVGRINHLENPADLINRNQYYDLKSRENASNLSGDDELSQIIDMAQHEFGYFVREIKQFPEPFVVLATDKQLLDLERFSSDDNEQLLN